MVSRALTKDETALAQSVFGASIDYARVKVSDQKWMPFHPKNTAMTPNGNLYMNDCYAEDYARSGSYMRSLFIHEMTHVWQFQNKILNPITEAIAEAFKHKFNYSAAYPYTLDASKDLLDYGMEQQAAIVQDHFLLTHEHSTHARDCQNACSNEEKIELFAKVLEKFHANPSYAKRDAFPKAGKKPKP